MRTKQVKKLKVTTRDRHLTWINHYVTNDFGIWIECTACKKWRKNYDYSESHEVPENWICSMGTSGNGEKGKCEDPEENSEEEYLEYCPGSVVWARLDGYPWWPGMVDEDPDIEEYFWQNKNGSYFYNVTFLDEHVTHAWIPATCMSPYLKPPHRNSCLQKQYKRNKYSNAILKAEERARAALKLTIKERLKNFSFVYLYKGKWPLADNFEDDEESNPLDITDILLQEMDDLDSIDSFGTDDQEENVVRNSDFLPSEKKVIRNGFDYLKKKDKVESLNRMKNSFKHKMHRKSNENGGSNILKSIENIQIVKSLEDTECDNFINKKNTNSVSKNETTTSKRSKNSCLSNKKLKTGNNCFQSTINKEPSLKTADITREEEYELIDISNPNDSEISVFSSNMNKLLENTPEKNTIEKECISANRIISEKNILNKIDSETTDPDKFNNISPLEDIAINEIVSEKNVNREPKNCDTPTDETKEEVLQNRGLKLPDSSKAEGSKNFTGNIVKSLEIAISNNKEVSSFASHLDECITNVINNANMEIESPLLSIRTPKKKVKLNGKPKCHILENVSSKDGYVTSSGIPKVPKETSDISIPEVSKQKKCKNTEITPVKKSTKLVGYDKLKLNKNVITVNGKEFKNIPINDSKAVTEINTINLKKNVNSKERSEPKKQCNIPNYRNKIKPDFKTFKRPFKNTNAPLQNNVTNLKQHTQENVKEKFNTETNSLQLSNTDATNLISNDEKSYSCVPVDDETIKKPIMKRAIENSLATETDLGDFVTGNKENNLEVFSIDDDENADQDIKHKDEREDTDDCFFYVPISDEE